MHVPVLKLPSKHNRARMRLLTVPRADLEGWVSTPCEETSPVDKKASGSAVAVAPCATNRDRDIKNEPSIISIEIVSMGGCFMCKMIPHQHQQQLLKHDGMPLLMSTGPARSAR